MFIVICVTWRELILGLGWQEVDGNQFGSLLASLPNWNSSILYSDGTSLCGRRAQIRPWGGAETVQNRNDQLRGHRQFLFSNLGNGTIWCDENDEGFVQVCKKNTEKQMTLFVHWNVHISQISKFKCCNGIYHLALRAQIWHPGTEINTINDRWYFGFVTLKLFMTSSLVWIKENNMFLKSKSKQLLYIV